MHLETLLHRHVLDRFLAIEIDQTAFLLRAAALAAAADVRLHLDGFRHIAVVDLLVAAIDASPHALVAVRVITSSIDSSCCKTTPLVWPSTKASVERLPHTSLPSLA
jgi:hypothetical protein